MALLLALFALLLLSGIGLCMILASTTETRIDANYSGSLRSYYAARSGLEEVRDRINFPSNSPTFTNGLADFLPQDIAGNAGGVLYVLNPANGETVDPTDPASPYYDDQLCHDYSSGVSARDSKCTVLPATPNWMALKSAAASAAPGAVPLGYKWVRINIKTNRMAAPYFVDQVGAAATLDSRVCWDGETEQLTPGTTNPSCDANGMQTVYMLSSLAATSQTGGPNGSRKFLRLEVVAPSIRPPGVITMGTQITTSSVTLSTMPVLGGASIPASAIDGRAHKLDGTLVSPNGTPTPQNAACSSVAPLGADGATGTTQIEAALNAVRKNIVTSPQIIPANPMEHQQGTSAPPAYGGCEEPIQARASPPLPEPPGGGAAVMMMMIMAVMTITVIHWAWAIAMTATPPRLPAIPTWIYLRRNCWERPLSMDCTFLKLPLLPTVLRHSLARLAIRLTPVFTSLLRQASWVTRSGRSIIWSATAKRSQIITRFLRLQRFWPATMAPAPAQPLS